MCCARDISIEASETSCWVLGGLFERNIFRACQQLNINVDQHQLYVAMQMSPNSSVLGQLKLRNEILRN